ncbi:hypothetical protein [Vibrio fortis]|uniref:hypothetical protein n=1 Tax=Vibrio fortis TaxID=212667 RepID=UPI0036F3F7B8
MKKAVTSTIISIFGGLVSALLPQAGVKALKDRIADEDGTLIFFYVAPVYIATYLGLVTLTFYGQ